MNLRIARHTNIKTGLNDEQVLRSQPNVYEDKNSRSYKQIIHDNFCTLFNAINLVLGLMVFITGAYRNMMFVGLVFLNTVIGIIQEIRSKKILDNLALLNQQKANVLRNGKIKSIPVEQIVCNDILMVRTGDQISVDAIVVEGQVECNESILTGESDSVIKKYGDALMSGSFVVSGQAKAQVVKVGADTYSHSILESAKREKQYPSELRDSINAIIRFSTIVLIPTGSIMLIKQLMENLVQWRSAILSTVAAVIGMIPEGLVLLTSTALAMGAVKLARKQVLVQELYCIETLARVDTLCLDKTGTITQGKMKVVLTDGLGKTSDEEIQYILANMYSCLSDDNATAQAIRTYAGKGDTHCIRTIPFSSSRKASAVVFEGNRAYMTGAYSFIVNQQENWINERIESYAQQGMRVLVLAKGRIMGDQIRGNNEVIGLIGIQDVLRPNIRRTLQYFYKQNVNVKIISGDDPRTVAAIAQKAGVKGRAVDMTTVKDIDQAVQTYSIFGRVTPEQKKQMVVALQGQGHTVAMTGDGVNDVMALKEADCSIAMGSGSEATKGVASLVLLKDQFRAMPSILREGRIVINNIQRSASLFLVKTMFSFGLSLITIFWFSAYPFKPIQLSLVSLLGTGIPGFVLALEPNEERVTGHFLQHVFGRALPGAVMVILSVVFANLFRQPLQMSGAQFSTICTIVASWNSLCVLYTVCTPMTQLRKLLLICMFAGLVIGLTLFHSLLYLVGLTFWQGIYVACNLAIIPDCLLIMKKAVDKTFLRNA
ncbi:HAD-IC family P-type ATPase [Absicoccus porci]|uniref:HAD-IC family P-type ATPase n=1 Tax=Absicoccus porci TaxID=2486576 RepID=UPI003F8AF10B